MIELKPCPCCGSEATCLAEYYGYENGENIYRGVAGCESCGLGFEEWHVDSDPMFDGYEDPSECEAVLEKHMATKWNTRCGAKVVGE